MRSSMMGSAAMVLVSVLMLVLPGCASEAETAIDQVISTLDDISDRLAKIKTKEDLASAKPDLKALGAKLKAQTQEMEKLENVSADERERLRSKYQPKLEKAQQRMQEQLSRIAKDIGPEAMFELGSMLDA